MLMRILSRIDQSSFDANTIGSARCTLPLQDMSDLHRIFS